MTLVQAAAALAALATAFALTALATAAPAAALGRIPVSAPPLGWRLRGVLGRVGASALGRRIARERIGALSVAAGSGWSADELAGAKASSLMAAAGFSLAIGVPLLAGPLCILAWRTPEILLARRARRRMTEASREVPLFLDLLAVASAAGLAPQLAVRLAVEPLRGPLAAELGIAMRRTDLGRRWRDELAAAAEHVGLADLRRIAAILERSESLGSTLADEMSRLAADVHAERRSHAAERARTAPIKMLFPLVFLILPAFLLLTVVPVLLSTVRSIG